MVVTLFGEPKKSIQIFSFNKLAFLCCITASPSYVERHLNKVIFKKVFFKTLANKKDYLYMTLCTF